MRQELKKQLNKLSVFIRWLPLALPYWIANRIGARWQTQALLMPPPRVPLIFWVPPASITHETTRKSGSAGISFARRGNWDRDKIRIRCSIDGKGHDKSPFKGDFLVVKQLFVDQLPLEDVLQYQVMMKKISAGKTTRGYKTKEQVHDYFAAMRQANHSIATEGYKTSADLGGMVRDEISIWVTRDGQLVYGGWGNHRLAMADLHKIEQVPVSILGAHPDWLTEQCKLHSLPPHEALRRWISKWH